MQQEAQQPDYSRDQFLSDTYKKYNSPLRNFIAKRIPSKEDCEDVLQNVFYQLAKTDVEENPIEQISAWLYAVARNQIIDRSRKKREEELPSYTNNEGETVFIQELTETILVSDSPDSEYLKTLIWEELELALAELPDEQRNVFVLNELDGISFKEISEATGIGVNTLITRKRYAVLHLRKRLYNLYEELLSD